MAAAGAGAEAEAVGLAASRAGKKKQAFSAELSVREGGFPAQEPPVLRNSTARLPKSGSVDHKPKAPGVAHSFISPQPSSREGAARGLKAGAARFSAVFPKSGSVESKGEQDKDETPFAFPFRPRPHVPRSEALGAPQFLRSTFVPISEGLPPQERQMSSSAAPDMVHRRFAAGAAKRGQSVIMCMDPMCNRCPPEMHMHMHMKNAAPLLSAEKPSPAAKQKRKFKLEDLDLFEDEEEEEEQFEQRYVVTIRCCGLKLSFERPSMRRILPPVFNPHNKYVKLWTQLLLYISFLAFFVDPLFLYALSFSYEWYCAYTKWGFLISLVVIRTLIDAFTLANMVLFSRLAFKATQAHVRSGSIRNSWGELVRVGELVIDDEKAIFYNYCQRFLLLDILNLIPYPQIVYLCILTTIPTIEVSDIGIVLLRISALLQSIPRLFRIIPVVSGRGGYQLMESAWSTFLLNLFAFMTASHVIGALWFILTEQRVADCMEDICGFYPANCATSFLSCNGTPTNTTQIQWINSGTLMQCYNGTGPTNYGLFTNGVQAVYLDSWFNQWLYTIMWGFQQISTFGGNLVTTTAYGEVIFLILIIALGLFLFALLIGNMQNFLQSLSSRMTAHQMKMRDISKWMEQKDFPRDLQRRVRNLQRYVWTTTEGVDEEALISTLTEDIQRDVRQHLFLQPIKKCHLLAVMPNSIQDAICERLKSRQFIDGTAVIREGNPVCRMFFVLRGALESVATQKGRTGFFERVVLGKGDFFGEELLVYFIEKYSGEKPKRRRASLRREVTFSNSTVRDALPRSERTVRCLGPVDGFSLEAEDIDYVCTQFYKDMQSEAVQRALNMCSQTRRTQAATTIQVWWRNVLRRRLEIPFDVMLQAVRTRRLGMLIRNAGELEDLTYSTVLAQLREKKAKAKAAGPLNPRSETPGKSTRKVSWLGTGSTSSRDGSKNSTAEFDAPKQKKGGSKKSPGFAAAAAAIAILSRGPSVQAAEDADEEGSNRGGPIQRLLMRRGSSVSQKSSPSDDEEDDRGEGSHSGSQEHSSKSLGGARGGSGGTGNSSGRKPPDLDDILREAEL